MGPLFVGMKRRDEQVFDEEEDRSPVLESYRQHLEAMPERKKASGIRKVLGTILESIGKPGSGFRRLGEDLKYPGYRDTMDRWGQQEQKLGGLAKVEAQQTDDERRAEESRARISASKRAEQYWQTQQGKQNMPTRRNYNSPAALKAARLADDLESEDPEVRTRAEKELNDLTAKGHPSGLTAQRFENPDTGEVTVKFYDHTGKEVSRDTHPYGGKPKTVPTRPRRRSTVTKTEDDEGNVTFTTTDAETGKEVGSFVKKGVGKKKKSGKSSGGSAKDRLAERLGLNFSGVDPSKLK